MGGGEKGSEREGEGWRGKGSRSFVGRRFGIGIRGDQTEERDRRPPPPAVSVSVSVSGASPF